jgi:hypothetical protein
MPIWLPYTAFNSFQRNEKLNKKTRKIQTHCIIEYYASQAHWPNDKGTKRTAVIQRLQIILL